jgi:N-acetylmuramoyl-L-alanine amidase
MHIYGEGKMNLNSYFLSRLTVGVFILLTFSSVVAANDEIEPEIRGMWLHRFEWPNTGQASEPEVYRDYIRKAMQDLSKANFNAVFFQVRGQADVLYPSEFEPWSPLIGARDPGFDLVAYAIEQAHKNGLEFHAYMNPYPLWHFGREDGPGFGPEKMPLDTNPEHLYYKHGPDTDDPWVVYEKEGEPYSTKWSYVYLSPGHPEVQAYLRKVLMDFVERYDIDGVHYDRIRYPGPEYSQDPVSLSRFEGAGNPKDLSWEDWQREQIAKFLNDMAAEIHQVRPGIRLSGAVWGLYNRYHIPGYENFSSGYHDYYQDSFLYARQGSMDTLIPMIYWPIADPKPNYDEVLDYFATQIDPARLAGGIALRAGDIDSGETFNEILYSRQRGVSGTVLFSYGNVGQDQWEKFNRKVYPKPAPIPAMPWKKGAAVVCGYVLDDEGKPVVDAAVQVSGVDDQKWTTDADGYFAFINVPAGWNDLSVTWPDGKNYVYSNILVRTGDYIRLTCRPFDGARCNIRFEPKAPRAFSETSSEFTNILSLTLPENTVTVNEMQTPVYKTGVFVYDRIPLEMGLNKITTEIKSGCYDLLHVNWIKRVRPQRRKPVPPLPVAINEESIQPRQELWLNDGDSLPVSFRGAPGHFGFFRIGRATDWQPMVEEAPGYYTGEYLVQAGDEFENEYLEVTLERNREVEGATRSRRSVRIDTQTEISMLNRSAPLIVEVTEERTQLLYGLAQVRLGGPILTLADPGIRLRVTGKVGQNYRVQLSETVEAWVSGRNVRRLPVGTQIPRDYLTSFSVTEDEGNNYLSFGLNAHLPHRIKAHNYPARLEIDLFGVTSNTTWITHRVEEGIKEVDWEQVEPGLLRIHVLMDHEQLWGYAAGREGRSLRVRIKKPPQLAQAPASPVKGLKIAVEAGHGGRNTGARGLSGLLEKDVNRGTASFLIEILEEAGAETVDLRPGDSYPTLGERVEKAVEEDADILISIHANAAGTSQGYLRVTGVSTYFKPMPWKTLADKIYVRLLEVEGLNPWGVIGSFNYTPIRITEMPSMLVEQAFMSHPGDEEILFDPVKQKEMARAIFLGLEDYLDEQRMKQ